MTRLILALILLITPQYAYAQKITKSGAAQLQAGLQAFLDYNQDANNTVKSYEYIYDGALKVEPKDTYYAVTFPHITIKSLPRPDKPNTFEADLGVITMNAVHDDKPNYWKTVITMPSEITLRNPNQGTESKVISKEQKIIGIFNSELSVFTKFNMILSDVALVKDGQSALRLGAFQVFSNLDDANSNGIFSGPGFLSLKDLLIEPEGANPKGDALKIGDARVDFKLTNFKMPSLKEYGEKLDKNGDTLNALSNNENLSPKDTVDMLFDLYNFDMEGLDLTYRIKDLSIADSTKSALGEQQTIALKDAHFGMSFSDLMGDKGGLGIKLGFDGFGISPPPTGFNNVAPEAGKIDIRAENLPFKSLTQFAKSTAGAASQNPQNGQMLAMSVMARLPAILSQAGTRITMNKNGLKNEVYDLSMDGEIKMDMTALLGFAMKLDAGFKGLDELISFMPSNGKSKVAPTLHMLKMLGERSETPDGTSMYRYLFQSTPEGRFMLNGQPFNMLAPMAAQAGQKQQLQQADDLEVIIDE